MAKARQGEQQSRNKLTADVAAQRKRPRLQPSADGNTLIILFKRNPALAAQLPINLHRTGKQTSPTVQYGRDPVQTQRKQKAQGTTALAAIQMAHAADEAP